MRREKFDRERMRGMKDVICVVILVIISTFSSSLYLPFCSLNLTRCNSIFFLWFCLSSTSWCVCVCVIQKGGVPPLWEVLVANILPICAIMGLVWFSLALMTLSGVKGQPVSLSSCQVWRLLLSFFLGFLSLGKWEVML